MQNYPVNFKKQNVTFILNIFNRNTAAFLDLKGCKDTAIFVKAVIILWNRINVKSKDAWFKLDDKNRKPFESADDQRLGLILLLAEKFKVIDTPKSPYSGRVMCLTRDTSNTLLSALNGIVSLLKLLLNKDFNYVLPGTFQSDRLEGEFGVSGQSAKIMNSVAQLFNKLDIEKVVNH